MAFRNPYRRRNASGSSLNFASAAPFDEQIDFTQPDGTPITPPPGFPVTWPEPDDVHRHWTRDREHMPGPITPMYHSVVSRLAEEARARALPGIEDAALKIPTVRAPRH